MRFLKKIFWFIVRPNSFVAKLMMFGVLLAILLLAMSGHLSPVQDILDAPSVTFSIQDNFVISPWKVLKFLFVATSFLLLSASITGSFEAYLSKLRRLRVSSKALVGKLFQISVYTLFFFIFLDVLGIDLTTFTVVGGAIGIGIGFGLQKITSNFISGLILLFERSIETGDLIELDGGIFGFIRKTGGRFTLVETFDGKELMIPNEDFVTSRVTNWTFTNNQGRIEIIVGVSYSSDHQLAKTLLLEAARENPEASKSPEAECHIVNFGDSSVDFALTLWVDDVTKGRRPIQSEVMFEILKKFKANNIEIPFPQRDVHMSKH